jgi:hypothetical protein
MCFIHLIGMKAEGFKYFQKVSYKLRKNIVWKAIL